MEIYDDQDCQKGNLEPTCASLSKRKTQVDLDENQKMEDLLHNVTRFVNPKRTKA